MKTKPVPPRPMRAHFEFDPDFLPRPSWLARALSRLRAHRFRKRVSRLFGLGPAASATVLPACDVCGEGSPVRSTCAGCGATLELVRHEEHPRAIERPLASWEAAFGRVGCSIERDAWSETGGCVAEAEHFESGWRVTLAGPGIGDNPATARALNRAAAFLETLAAEGWHHG